MNPIPHGKISRLPHHIREQVHSRLRDHQTGANIIAWLNSLPEVNLVLDASFGGSPLTERNLSSWKQRAHRAWLIEQSALAEASRFVAQSRELAQAGQGTVTDHLASFVAARYAVATRRLGDDVDEGEHMKRLRTLCRDVVDLRRRDQYAEWLRLQRQRLELSHPSTPNQ
ncbi:MAG: hypothetical protein ABSA47_06635 [Verrucomicrobiota bacterium]|jgi:hypothetical protein